MRTDVRERYDLEGLWGDAARVKSTKQNRPKINIETELCKPADDNELPTVAKIISDFIFADAFSHFTILVVLKSSGRSKVR